MAGRDEHRLTAKQRAFADMYRAAEDPAVRGNATACYLEVYGGSENAARAHGARLVANGNVQAYLAAHAKKSMDAADISEERVLREVARIAFFDPRRILASDGSPLPPREWPDDVAAAVSGLEVVETQQGNQSASRVSKVRFWSKDKHLECLTRVLQTIREHPTVNLDLNTLYERIVEAASREGRIPGVDGGSGVG